MTINPSALWVIERIQKTGRDWGPRISMHSTSESRHDAYLGEVEVLENVSDFDNVHFEKGQYLHAPFVLSKKQTK